MVNAVFFNNIYFFGTFNPIHLGHLLMAAAAYDAMKEDMPEENWRVVFVPTGLPPHRTQDTDLVPAAHRLAMVRLATQDDVRFVVDAYECQQPGPHYTADTLLTHFAPGPDTHPIPFIIGSDALRHVGTWHRAADLLPAVLWLQAPRPDVSPTTHARFPNGQQMALPHMHLLANLPPCAVSATWVRRQRQAERCVRYAVPEPVRLYMEAHGLYTARETTRHLQNESISRRVVGN
jgi:nicotinate-nucleotide adenylyltransferase